MRRVCLWRVVCCMCHVPRRMVTAHMGMLHEEWVVLGQLMLGRVLLLRIVEGRLPGVLESAGALVMVVMAVVMVRLVAV